MSFRCPICSDSLVRAPEDPTNTDGSKLSCAPCGHVFHSFCIKKWLEGTLTTSSQCPCCRVNIPKKKCLPLFPDISLDDTLDEEARCNHVPVIQDLQIKVGKLERDLGQCQQLKATLLDDCEGYKNQLESKRKQYEKILFQYKQRESLETYVEELQGDLKATKDELKGLTTIRDIVESVKNECELQDEDYPPTVESISVLKTMKGILTRELKAARSKSREASTQQLRYREETRKTKNLVATLTKEKEALENTVAELKIELEHQQSEDNEIKSPLLIPNRKRKSGSESGCNRFLKMDQSVIELSPEIDADIGVIKPFHQPRRDKKESKFRQKLVSSTDLSTVNSKPKTSKPSSSFKISKSESDVLASNSSSSSAEVSKPGKSKKPVSTSDDFGDFANVKFSANLKSSIVGLAVTPTTSFRRGEPKTNFGIPKPPKVLKKK